MKLLHTADWHLGQHLCDQDRAIEHQRFLDFLIGVIRDEAIDLFVHAGDVFHTANPPNSALRQYYRFLLELANSPCRMAVITGGNHDAVSTLNAPRELLRTFDIHVVGGATDPLDDELVLLHDENGRPEAAVAAVPFLRDRDLRTGGGEERPDARDAQIREGIRAHYRRLGELARPHAEAGLPVIATGHLYAAGSTPSDSEKDIHIGNLGQVGADVFPDTFAYVALGHLHRPQIVGGQDHIRYAGSPIPLSFSEIQDGKQVLIVAFDGPAVSGIRSIPVPPTRELRRFSGDPDTVREALHKAQNHDGSLATWGEVRLELDGYDPEIARTLREEVDPERLDLLKVSVTYRGNAAAAEPEHPEESLDDLSPAEVFQRRCDAYGIDPAEKAELARTFAELLDGMNEEQES